MSDVPWKFVGETPFPDAYVYNAVNYPIYRGTAGARFVNAVYDNCENSGTNYTTKSGMADGGQYYSVQGLKSATSEHNGGSCDDGTNLTDTSNAKYCFKPLWPLCTNNNWYGGERFYFCEEGFTDNYPNTILDNALITDGSYGAHKYGDIDDYNGVNGQRSDLNNMEKTPGFISVGNLFLDDTKEGNDNSKNYIPEANMFCVFDPTKFETLDQVEAYVQKWGKYFTPESDMYNDQKTVNNPTTNFDSIMYHFCAIPQKSENCPIDPVTGYQMKPFCSTFLSNTPAGDECRSWVNSKMINNSVPWNDTTVNGSYRRYCEKYRDKTTNLSGPDCACIMRNDVNDDGTPYDPNYAAAKSFPGFQGTGVSDGCWWIPCQDPMHYLIDKSIFSDSSTLLPSLVCGTEFCNEFNLYANSGNVDINNNDHYLSCFVTPDDKLPSKKILILIGCMVGITIFFIALILFFIFKKGNSQNFQGSQNFQYS